MWALVKDGAIVERIASPKGMLIDGTHHPRGIFTLWSDAERAKIGIYPAVMTGSAPSALHKEIDPSSVFADGVATFTRKFQEIDLEAAKELAKNAVGSWKRDKQEGGLVFDGATFETDERSRNFISGAVLKSVLSQITQQPFSISWTDANNQQHAFDATQMIAFGTAVAVHIETCHMQAVAVRSAIEAETTVAGINAVLTGFGVV